MARISNVSRWTLDGPILLGRVGSRQLDGIPSLSKQVKDFCSDQVLLQDPSERIWKRPWVRHPCPLVSHSMGGALEQRAAP
jgi:hypothetical protein